MAVSIKSNLTDKRAIFSQGEQVKFLLSARKKSKLLWSEFARNIKVHSRTLCDWKREKYSIPLAVLEKICRKVKVKVPYNIKIKDRFWYVNKGAKKGGIITYKKYGRVGGDPEYRKKKWYEWWEKEGKYRKDLITAVTKPIKKPVFSPKLAEFIGILLGDGGIAKNQVTITLNRYDDKEYANYVRNLFANLFKVIPTARIRQRASIIDIVVSRTELVKFLIENGLKIGSKVRQQVGVPKWIEDSANYSKTCLRGLFDTDGSFYVDKHKYKDRIYFNAGMAFTNRSLPLIEFFKKTLERFSFSPTQKTKFMVFLRREREIIRYFDKIGSSNPKHLRKYKNYLNVIRGGVG